MKILSLGSTGMMGTALERACVGKKIECISLGHADIEITDANALRKIIERYQPEVVVNFVAMVGINPCEEDPQRAFEVNGIAVSNLAKICRDNEMLLIQPSSHAVFDGTKVDPYIESDAPNPTGVYSISKFASWTTLVTESPI